MHPVVNILMLIYIILIIAFLITSLYFFPQHTLLIICVFLLISLIDAV